MHYLLSTAAILAVASSATPPIPAIKDKCLAACVKKGGWIDLSEYCAAGVASNLAACNQRDCHNDWKDFKAEYTAVCPNPTHWTPTPRTTTFPYTFENKCLSECVNEGGWSDVRALCAPGASDGLHLCRVEKCDGVLRATFDAEWAKACNSLTTTSTPTPTCPPGRVADYRGNCHHYCVSGYRPDPTEPGICHPDKTTTLTSTTKTCPPGWSTDYRGLCNPPPTTTPCPAGTYSDYRGHCIPYCPSGSHTNYRGSCVPDTATTTITTTCPAGTYYDYRGHCIPYCTSGFHTNYRGSCVPDSTTTPATMTCPAGSYYDYRGHCIPYCTSGYHTNYRGMCTPDTTPTPVPACVPCINKPNTCICPGHYYTDYRGCCWPDEPTTTSCPTGSKPDKDGKCTPFGAPTTTTLVCPPGSELKDGKCVPFYLTTPPYPCHNKTGGCRPPHPHPTGTDVTKTTTVTDIETITWCPPNCDCHGQTTTWTYTSGPTSCPPIKTCTCVLPGYTTLTECPPSVTCTGQTTTMTEGVTVVLPSETLLTNIETTPTPTGTEEFPGKAPGVGVEVWGVLVAAVMGSIPFIMAF